MSRVQRVLPADNDDLSGDGADLSGDGDDMDGDGRVLPNDTPIGCGTVQYDRVQMAMTAQASFTNSAGICATPR